MALKVLAVLGATLGLALTASPGLAGKTGVGGIGGLPVFIPAQTGKALPALTTENDVSEEVQQAVAFCARLPEKAYLVDCLAEQFDGIARSISGSGELAGAKASLAQAAQELSGLARANADQVLPRVTVRTQSGRSTRRPLTPVNTARRAEVQALAANILQRTETQLLRSSARSGTQVGYRSLAGAVASGKVLLRSA